MGLIVYWTQIAEDKLDDIFYYYKLKASLNVAQNLVNGIVDTTIDLNKNPQIGQREILLKDRFQEFRYLIYKNYKIIYGYHRLAINDTSFNATQPFEDPIQNKLLDCYKKYISLEI